VTEFKGNLLF